MRTTSITLTLLALAAVAPLSAQARKSAAPAKVVWPDEGPRTWTPRPTVAAITPNDLRTRLYQLADDSMMGRVIATLGNQKAAEYIAGEFKRMGLTPGGTDGYFQEIQYGGLNYDSTRVQLMAGSQALKVGTDWTPATPNAALGLTGVFTTTAVPTVFGGRWNDTATVLDPAVVRGKIVVFLNPPAPRGPQQPQGNACNRPTAPARPQPAAIRDLRAQRAGAVGILLVADALPLASPFVSRTGLMPFVTGTTGAANITTAAAAQLFPQALNQVAVGTVGQPVSGSWNYDYHRPQYPARNVIGILRGSDPTLSNTYVVIGAHNDHVNPGRGVMPEHDSLRAFNTVLRPQGANDQVCLDSVTTAQWARINGLIANARSIRPARRDSIMNGADDDGSGTAVLMEIAEQMAKEKAPARSVIFISHVGEEAGLLGSQWFTDHPTVPRDSIVAAHNMDMLGKGRNTDVAGGGPASIQMLGSRRLSDEFGQLIDSLNANRKEVMAVDYSWDMTNKLNRFCRSDQVNYFRYAIPVTYFSLGYARDYHQATDEPQYIDYEHGARVGRFVHDIAFAVADRKERLTVLPPEQRNMSARCGN